MYPIHPSRMASDNTSSPLQRLPYQAQNKAQTRHGIKLPLPLPLMGLRSHHRLRFGHTFWFYTMPCLFGFMHTPFTRNVFHRRVVFILTGGTSLPPPSPPGVRDTGISIGQWLDYTCGLLSCANIHHRHLPYHILVSVSTHCRSFLLLQGFRDWGRDTHGSVSALWFFGFISFRFVFGFALLWLQSNIGGPSHRNILHIFCIFHLAFA